MNKPSGIILSYEVLIKKISCGPEHSLFLSKTGDIYMLGSDGIDKENPQTKLSTKKNKFKDIEAHNWFQFSAVLSVNGLYYIWGKFEEKVIREPVELVFKSLEDIFIHHFEITFKTMSLDKSGVEDQKLSNDEQEISQLNVNKNSLKANISKAFNDPKYSDLKLKIEEKHIYVHKVILGMNCNYFVAKLTDDSRAMRESTEDRKIQNEIEIKEYSYDVYYAFLKYIYTDCIDIENEKAIDLLILANDYKQKDLKKKCFNIIKINITIENVCYLYCISISKNLKELEDYCFEFAFDHLKEVMNTEAFQRMDENSVKIFKYRFFDKQTINN
jgi:RCC1 and BTB domain-containing protein